MTKKILIKTLILTFILFITIAITSCNKKKETNYLDNSIAIVYKNNNPYIINKNNELYDLSKYDSIMPYFDKTLIVKKDNKFGFIKNTGEPLTEIIYNEAYPFSEGKAVVSINDNYHIINEEGSIIFSLEIGVSSCTYFSEDKLVVTKNDKQGYLKYDSSNNSFNYLITSAHPENTDSNPNFIYDYCGEFKDGYAVVGNLSKDNQLKYTHINSAGNRLYDLEWDYANNFSEGYAVVGEMTDYDVLVYCSKENQFDKNNASTNVNLMGYKYVDPNGTYFGKSSTEPYVFAMAQDFNDGIGLVANLYFYVEDELRWGNYDYSTERYFYNYDFINKDGNHIFEVPGYYLVNQNNFGGNITIYDDIFVYENYYIATYFRTCWYINYSNPNSFEPTAPFITARYDIEDYKSYKTNEEKIKFIEENYSWINDYLDEFTIGNNNAIYAADKVITPYTMTNYKQSQFLDNKLVAKAQVYSGMEDSCGIITINIVDGIPQLSYIIPPLYEEIIY